MIANYLLFVLLLHIVIHSYANQEKSSTSTNDLESAFNDVLSVLNSIESRRVRTEHLIEHCTVELMDVVQGVGIVGDMQTIRRRCEEETDEKLTQIYSSFQTEIEWAEPAALRAINDWFACLPITTQQNALAEYYLEELLNIVADSILKMQTLIIDKEGQSIADLYQNLDQMLRLNVVALEDLDNLDKYQKLFETQYRTACALTKISSDNLYNQNGIMISDAAQRVVGLIEAALAIEI